MQSAAFGSYNDENCGSEMEYEIADDSEPNSMIIEEADQFEETPADYNFKVIVVGNKRVGKTSITNRCVFDEFNEQSQSTRVVQIVPKIFNIAGTEKRAQLHIWDTLGQEKFMSLSSLFFRRSVGAFLVYDVSSMESF